VVRSDFKIAVEKAINKIEDSRIELEELKKTCLKSKFVLSAYDLSVASFDLAHGIKAARNFLKSLK